MPGNARLLSTNNHEATNMGGGSSQPKNTTTTTKTELPPFLQNAYQGFFNQTNQVNSKPYQSYDGQLNADLSPGQ